MPTPGIVNAYSDLRRRPSNREQAQQLFEALCVLAQAQGLALRAPPPEPTTCCGRGCNGCVWEGFFDAAAFWQDDALACVQLPSEGLSALAG